MGNCIVPASSMEWDDDEDRGNYLRYDGKNTRSSSSSSSSSKVFDEAHVLSLVNYAKKEKLLGALRDSCGGNGKVTIKISKKEVAELLGVIENQQHQKKKSSGGGASAEQILIRLINARDRDHENYHDHHHGPWRPMLETVPELD